MNFEKMGSYIHK